MTSCLEHHAIVDVLNLYATALDTRDWTALEGVFHEDSVGLYGESEWHGRDEIIRNIASFLDPCGPTQHLLGNYEVCIGGVTATTRTKARVIHVGAGENASLVPYECIGSYIDQWQKTSDGWRLTRRHFDVNIETGDRRIFLPPKIR